MSHIIMSYSAYLGMDHTKHRSEPQGTKQKTTKERSVTMVHTYNKQTAETNKYRYI